MKGTRYPVLCSRSQRRSRSKSPATTRERGGRQIIDSGGQLDSSMEPSDVVSDTPTLERSFRGHKDAISSVCFNPNMKQLISGGHDSCVMVWNFRLQLRAFRFVGHKGPVLSVAAAPSGNLIASASKDRTVRLWLPTVKGESTVLKAHMAAVRSVAFSADGQSLASASDDKTIKVWGLPGQRFQFSLAGHSNWVRSAKFSPDGMPSLAINCTFHHPMSPGWAPQQRGRTRACACA